MNNSKPFYQSKTLQGIFLLLVPLVTMMFDVEIASEEWQALGEAVAVLVGLILSIYGRLTAKKKLTVS